MNKNRKEWIAAGVVVGIAWAIIIGLFIWGFRSCHAQLADFNINLK